MLSTWMLLSLVAALPADAPAETAWEADYGQALAQTREVEQPLLVVLDVPSDEAQRLNPELLDVANGAFPLDSYELCRVDVSTEYGKRVAKSFKVTEFPHVAIIDKSGSVILHRIKGEVTTDQWKSTLARHAEGLRSSGSRYTVAKPLTDLSSAGFVEPSETSSSKPYCASCQRNR
jgi:hypothetical protein